MKHFLCHILLVALMVFGCAEILAQSDSARFSAQPKYIKSAGKDTKSYSFKSRKSNNSVISYGDSTPTSPSVRTPFNFKEWSVKNNVLDHLDVGVSVGSMGLGLSVSSPVTKWVNLRAGIDWVPEFKVPLYFNLNTYADGMATDNFNHVAQMLYDITGIQMDETVTMHGYGHMLNFKLIADVYPVPSNRHWHVSAGFYAGTSQIGKSYNTKAEKPTLVALNIYNRAYSYFTSPELDIFDVPLGGGNYLDPDMVEKLQQRFSSYGRMGIHIGDFKDGTPYIMDPAPDGSVSAKAFVNHFKPYLGAGYSTQLDKSGKWNVAVDLGVLFWGGRPNVVNYDYTENREVSFTHDLINLRGKVKHYMKTIKSFPVYPVLEVRFSYNIL